MTADNTFGINVKFASPKIEALGDGFNQHGVRENEDGSIDVRFNAMEPGVRRGYEITPEFLKRVTSYNYSRLPLQLDHSQSQRANVGWIEPDEVGFSDGFANLGIHVPNTGSSIRDDIIADFTHEPPAINDISLSFEKDSVEVAQPDSADGNPKFVDARIKEASLTPFPAGYENGGLTPAFSEAIDNAVEAKSGETEDESSTSHLLTRQYEIK